MSPWLGVSVYVAGAVLAVLGLALFDDMEDGTEAATIALMWPLACAFLVTLSPVICLSWLHKRLRGPE